MDNIPGALILTVIVLVLAACAAPSTSLTPTLPFTELPHEATDLEDVTSPSDDPVAAEEGIAGLPDGAFGPVAPDARNSTVRTS